MPNAESHVAARSEVLLSFLRDMDEHIAALQAAGHERLAATTDAPSSVEITIRVGAEQHPIGDVAFDEALGTPTCVTVRVPCGKGKTGYIYCEISYCETTGPITVLPG
jgi:hypothetical protein